MDIINLGANIKIIGFSSIGPAKLVVVKKMIGNYARKISEKIGNFGELNMELENNNIKCKLMIDSRAYKAESTNANLFFAIDKALAEILETCS